MEPFISTPTHAFVACTGTTEPVPRGVTSQQHAFEHISLLVLICKPPYGVLYIQNFPTRWVCILPLEFFCDSSQKVYSQYYRIKYMHNLLVRDLRAGFQLQAFLLFFRESNPYFLTNMPVCAGIL